MKTLRASYLFEMHYTIVCLCVKTFAAVASDYYNRYMDLHFRNVELPVCRSLHALFISSTKISCDFLFILISGITELYMTSGAQPVYLILIIS